MSDDGEEPRRRLVRPPSGGDPAGRGQSQRLKTAKMRTPSQQHWLQRQIDDPYAAAARAAGYRSRAAFKLKEMDDRFGFLKPGGRVVDLGCAPGGWVQVAMERGAGKVVGVDLLPVDPLPPAEMILGDFTDPEVGPELIRMLGGAPDVVLSDMAPNTVGHRETDHLRIMGLIELAAAFAEQVLRPGGVFVTKSFQGGGSAEMMAALRGRYEQVRNVKPKSSRTESSEVYLVAIGLRGR
jgi:23S rRNA (uridine2552-2'-O)-methyltransferase